ncbi:MAG TPA: PqqD family peptide modification chaperone [Gemmatimonadaceae bacterium]|nr:PqqD family peptide modification chaperone [Gemmatimonadaceae bacterium]
MLEPRNRFIPNEDECAAKVIDGEAVLINLSNGTYYSMDKAGGFIWSLIAEGRSVDEIVDGLVSSYDVGRDRAAVDVERLLAELAAEKLVMPAVGERLVLSPLAVSGDKQPYDEPRLNSYRDMADLLALDPPMPGIKEVPWQPTSSATEQSL